MSIRPDRRRFLKALAASAAAAPLIPAFRSAEEVFAAELEEVCSPGLDLPSIAQLRDRYMLDPQVTYLNHASIGTMPRAVLEALTEYLRICESNPWLHIWGGAWEEAREAVREKAPGLLHCSSTEIAITRNTTEGFNVLARGLPLGRGDEVLYSSMNHVGAGACWEHVAPERGFRVRTFPFPLDRVPELTEAEIVELHLREIRPDTRVMIFTDLDNMVGLRFPLKALTREAKQAGVEFVLVDGAQGAGMIPLDLGESGVDAYATSHTNGSSLPRASVSSMCGRRFRSRFSR